MLCPPQNHGPLLPPPPAAALPAWVAWVPYLPPGFLVLFIVSLECSLLDAGPGEPGPGQPEVAGMGQ